MMKLNKFAIALGMSIAVMAISANAAPKDQGQGTVTFNGSIIDSPCSITPDTIDQTVNLGQVSNIALKDGGKSKPKNFQIKLENCDTATLKTVTTKFTGANSTGNGELLGITGTARGASIAITNGSGDVIKLGDPSKAQTIQDGNNVLAFSAYLQGDGASSTITPGEFQSIANFSLAYQ
ncbi:putative mannose-resistant/Proteus-like fimbrial protein [Yersinia mollaretii]|uniref:Mannose-resistant/Proteus-like fimbrial protein n=2 Tax=Yersinia mollaretii TaxID=33060 RepID=A0AA36LP52_YERMO|nr:putative mannose-resistant/Proteus-like fimbrial protein [Yersinia mollaretii]